MLPRVITFSSPPLFFYCHYGTYAKVVNGPNIQCAGQPESCWPLPRHILKRLTVTLTHPWKLASVHFRERSMPSHSLLFPLMSYQRAMIMIGTPERMCWFDKEDKKEHAKQWFFFFFTLSYPFPSLRYCYLVASSQSTFPLFPFNPSIQMM